MGELQGEDLGINRCLPYFFVETCEQNLQMEGEGVVDLLKNLDVMSGRPDRFHEQEIMPFRYPYRKILEG